MHRRWPPMTSPHAVVAINWLARHPRLALSNAEILIESEKPGQMESYNRARRQRVPRPVITTQPTITAHLTPKKLGWTDKTCMTFQFWYDMF